MVKDTHKLPKEEASARAAQALAGRCVALGQHSRTHLAGLLGLEGTPHAIEAVAWLDHAVEASVSEVDGEAVVLRLERRVKDSAGLIVSEHLVLYYRGERISESLHGLLEAGASERLGQLTIEALSTELARDPELGNPDLPMPPGVDEADRPGSLLDTWGDANAYADFFAGGEIARAQLDSLDPCALFSFFQHSDCECLHVNPNGGGPVVWLVNYPWDDRLRRGTTRFEQLDLISAATEGMQTSNLVENDVIMGNPEKLDRLLEQAKRLHERTGKAIFFSNTCTPVVTGEDVESKVRGFKEETGIPLLYLTVTPRSMVNVFTDVLVRRRQEAERSAGVAHEGTINLVGFQKGPDLDEIEALLEGIGIDVNVTFLPALTYALVDQLPGGSLNVFKPNQLWQHLYDQLQFSSKIPHINPKAPYGLGATVDWLREVAAALELQPERPEAFENLMAPFYRRLETLREQTREHRLGFVVRASETRFLSMPSSTWGIPLVDMLEELGFGLEFYIKVEDRRTAARSAREVHALFSEPDRHLIQAFDSQALMNRRLAESGAAAFFSSNFFDWRVTSNGKSLFSLQHFEMGPEGALRTGQRLLGICETPFYKKYQRYLGRTEQGLRIEPRRRR